MATDHIRYDVLARDALRGVLRRVLTDAAEHGLPGEHHFFITFLSTAEGVKLSPRLLAQYGDQELPRSFGAVRAAIRTIRGNPRNLDGKPAHRSGTFRFAGSSAGCRDQRRTRQAGRRR
jgi:hypothetical protein